MQTEEAIKAQIQLNESIIKDPLKQFSKSLKQRAKLCVSILKWVLNDTTKSIVK